jgi:peptidoglycan hydrolase CwlO-like protein
MTRYLRSRRAAAVIAGLFAAVGVLAGASASLGDLNARQQSLQQRINGESNQIQAYQGRLSDLETRLNGLESSLAIQQALLGRIEEQLAAARSRLSYLTHALVRDRRLLAAQLVAQYESPSPDIVDVVLESHGFTDLLEHVDQLRRIAQQNAHAVVRVAHDKKLVAVETVRLSSARARQQRVTSALLIEREQVAGLRLSVLKRERATVAERAHHQSELRAVQRQLDKLRARALAAQRASFADSSTQSSFSGGAFAPHSGDYGFFPAPGTNYTVGEEPVIAARLDALGKALGLHLIGLSGYRTPQHSVEVGGFADDPHTRGEASDTPGVEGVPEATLLRFGLTRPFPGAAEADHIQLA